MKINFVVKKVGGFGVKLTKNKGKFEAKFELKLIFPEFNQINGKLRVDNRNFKNYLGCIRYWWFGSQNNKQKG